MSRLTQKGQGGPIEVFKTSSDAALQTVLNTRFDSADGREFVLVLVGGVTISAGVLVQTPAIVDNNVNLAVAANAATAATSISLTNGGTAVTANQYAGGYAIVNAGTGVGQTLKVASHASATATQAISVTLEDPLIANISSSTSKVSLIANPGNGVVVQPTTITGRPIGATLYSLASATYGLIQSKGLIGLSSEASTASIAQNVTISAATAGWVKLATSPAITVGVNFQGGVSGESRGVWINL